MRANLQAALYANQIYLADRGPDITSQQIIYDTMQFDMTTVYWAIITPSFCVNGPCAPWFGTDWGKHMLRCCSTGCLLVCICVHG
jgi:hypothetical protein